MLKKKNLNVSVLRESNRDGVHVGIIVRFIYLFFTKGIIVTIRLGTIN